MDFKIRHTGKSLCLLAALFAINTILFSCLHAQNPEISEKEAIAVRRVLTDHIAENYNPEDFNDFIYVSLKSQRLYRIEHKQITESYTVSCASAGAGCMSGSNKTPVGLHSVCGKYGDNVPLGGIMKARQYTGKIATIYTDSTNVEEDDVTTRIMWLCGEEPGINKGGKVDSHNRYIYIHGTPEEGLLGTPASHGCIRMCNKEVIDLYNRVPSGTYVLILNK